MAKSSCGPRGGEHQFQKSAGLTAGATSDLGVLCHFYSVELTGARVQRPLVRCATSHAQIRGFSGGRKHS